MGCDNCYSSDCGSSPYNTLKKSSGELSGMEHDLAMLRDTNHSNSDISTDNHYAPQEAKNQYGIAEMGSNYLDLGNKDEESKNPFAQEGLDKKLEERDSLESHTSSMQLESHNERRPWENLTSGLSDTDRDTIERTINNRGK